MSQLQPIVPDGASRTSLRTDTIGLFLAREKHLQLLVSELGHRTKNLLAVVQAIANQTAHHSSDLKAFRSEFSQRIGALSCSLDLVIHEGDRGVSLAELVQSQLKPFGDIDGRRIVVTGPDVNLTREATQSIGLALHELATNATKYGALSVPDGTITVRWDTTTEKFGPPIFRFSWREQDGPPVTPPAHHGFGSAILQRGMSATPNCAIKHAFDVGGVSWTFEVPAATLLMPE